MLRDQALGRLDHGATLDTPGEDMADVLPCDGGGFSDLNLGDAAPLGSALNPM